jgi:hypothetical protein
MVVFPLPSLAASRGDLLYYTVCNAGAIRGRMPSSPLLSDPCTLYVGGSSQVSLYASPLVEVDVIRCSNAFQRELDESFPSEDAGYLKLRWILVNNA